MALQVALADGWRESGKALAVDRDTDLAIVKVDRGGLPAAMFQPKLPRVGALAVVLGSPLGFQKSVTVREAPISSAGRAPDRELRNMSV
jgi:serine protease DegQ